MVQPAFEPRFGHAAEEFQRYRPGYPPTLFERILAALSPDLRRRAMDLGAGTGRATRALLPHFDEVIAVEPDAEMAARLATQLPSAVVRRVTAEDCTQAPETVDLVTIANALHWMDMPRVLVSVHSWLKSGGVLAVIDPQLPKATPEVDQIIREELRGPWKPYRDERLRHGSDWKDKLHAAPSFRILEEVTIPQIVPTSPPAYTGFWRSTSYGSAYARTLPDPESYWRTLESRIAAAAPGPVIPVDFSPPLVLAAKVQGGSGDHSQKSLGAEPR